MTAKPKTLSEMLIEKRHLQNGPKKFSQKASQTSSMTSSSSRFPSSKPNNKIVKRLERTQEAAPVAVPAVTNLKPTKTEQRVMKQYKLSIPAIIFLKKRIRNFKTKNLLRKLAYGDYHWTPSEKYENTFITGPKVNEKFIPEAVLPVMSAVLKFWLAGINYSPNLITRFTKSISEDMIRRVKNKFTIPRYKLVCMVLIKGKESGKQTGNTNPDESNMRECAAGGVIYASKSLTDAKFDTHMTDTFSNPSLLAIATVFAIYYE